MNPLSGVPITGEHLEWIARMLVAAAGGPSGPRLTGELREACEQLGTALAGPRIICTAAGEPYLSRFYLLGGPVAGTGAFDEHGDPRPGTQWANLPVELYLHHLHRSDERGRLHSHPWTAAVSLILAGGYDEDRRDWDRVTTRRVDPLELNILRADDFHRIELAIDAWSLFLTGPATGRWYFWDPETGATTKAGR